MSNLVISFSDVQVPGSKFWGLTPFSHSEIYTVSILNGVRLTSTDDVKIVYKFTLNLEGVEYEFEPGDTIGILPRNPQKTIDSLLHRLNLLEIADKPCKLNLISNKKFPKHLPVHGTIRSIFRENIDVNTPPKKLFLKVLAQYSDAEADRLRLLKIADNSEEYFAFITGIGASLLSILEAFPSCNPPIAVILEHLPAMKPRFYSICTSRLQGQNIDITFNFKENGERGLCTGYLEDSLLLNRDISFYFREPTEFRLPPSPSKPLILLASGTGIAPFRSFLQHLSLTGCSTPLWLLYGCRNSNDYLYKDEMEDFHKNGVITRLDVAFSRTEPKKYIQDIIGDKSKEFLDWILNQEAVIYICGDQKTVLPDIKTKIVDLLVGNCDLSHISADQYFEDMDFDGRFIVDRWI